MLDRDHESKSVPAVSREPRIAHAIRDGRRRHRGRSPSQKCAPTRANHPAARSRPRRFERPLGGVLLALAAIPCYVGCNPLPVVSNDTLRFRQPAPKGACCINDYDCEMLTKTDCAARNGTYQADNASCGDLPPIDPDHPRRVRWTWGGRWSSPCAAAHAVKPKCWDNHCAGSVRRLHAAHDVGRFVNPRQPTRSVGRKPMRSGRCPDSESRSSMCLRSEAQAQLSGTN